MWLCSVGMPMSELRVLKVDLTLHAHLHGNRACSESKRIEAATDWTIIFYSYDNITVMSEPVVAHL